MICRLFRQKLVISLILLVVIIPLLTAQTRNPTITSEPVFKQNEATVIPLPCTIRGDYCSTNASCKTTIINPENNVLINNKNMTRDDAVFVINLTENQTDVVGEYQFNVVCSDNGFSSSRFLKFYITPNGELPDTAKGIIYIGLVILLFALFVLSIFFATKQDKIPLKMGLFLAGYLLFIGITFIAWNLSLDYLTSSPFLIAFFRILWYVALVGLVPLIMILSFFTIWMMIQMKEIQKMIDKGVPSDEAYERTVRKGMKSFGKIKW